LTTDDHAVVLPAGGSQQAPPEDMLQVWLVRLWERLLGRTGLGIDDGFFEVGGTPELCDRMLTMAEELFGEPVRASEIRGALTVRTLTGMVLSRLETRASGITARRTPARVRAHTSPEDHLQDRLADLWERSLGRADLGIDDDFFALGGTRESAERMFADVEALYGERLDQDIRAADALTLRSLSDALVSRVSHARAFRIQNGAAGMPPLFFLHGDFGGAGYYVRELARGLGERQPVVTLQLHGMHGEDVPPSIEAIAADHVATLTESYGDGPLYLGGHCMNAIIAFEMAQQLVARGRDVARLLLIEPPFPCGASPFAVLPPPRLSPQVRRLPRLRVSWLMSEYLAILYRYQPAPYFGDVSVFWVRDDSRPFDVPERRTLMRSLAPKADVYSCPGTHVTALGRHINSLAGLLRECLQPASDGEIDVKP
jgi:pimeloyl-ACP methyl ester carboxylesterase